MIDKIHIPLVYDHPFKSNVWHPNVTGSEPMDIYRSERFHRQIPWVIQTFDPLLSVHSKYDIPSLDWFIYPVSMNEPFYQLRSLIGNYHHDYGFWSFISPLVIEALREKKGWILIDATLEPLRDQDLKQILSALSDVSEFPNDRILINVSSLKYVNHPQVVSLPSWLEIHFCGAGIHEYKDTHLVGGVPRDWTYLGERILDISYSQKMDKKKFCLFQMRWWKNKGSAILLYLMGRDNQFIHGYTTANELDKFQEFFKDISAHSMLPKKLKDFSLQNSEEIIDPVDNLIDYQKSSSYNIVVEAYYENDVVDWPMITEKIWRNVGYRKPFIVVGQRHLLKKFHELGYKSFDEFIDESYDSESDDIRVFVAYNEVKKLNRMSQTDLENLCGSIDHIYDHNDHNFQKRVSSTYRLFQSMSKNDIDFIRNFTQA